MRMSRTWSRVAGGAAFAAAVAVTIPSQQASARGQHQNATGGLKLTDIDVGTFAGVPQNQIIDMTFTQPINPASVSHATIQIRAQNATRTGYTIDVPGTFQILGSLVRFFPRLPTNLRDPADPAGGFYQPGSPRDNADLNAGLQPNTNHQISVIGKPSLGSIRSVKGKILDRTYGVKFRTSPDTPKSEAFTTDTYSDPPPDGPGFRFSNPPDKVASAGDQYARHGGQQDVPSAIGITLFATKTPLSPSTVRQSGNFTLTMISRRNDPLQRKPIGGNPFLEQNFDTVRMVFQPRFPLPDVGSYALRVENSVKDLTEQFSFKANADRLRLRDIYEFMVAARTLAPVGTPAEQLSDPPENLISTGDAATDWPKLTDPGAATARGVLKRNVLALGDTYPDEVDPRVMVLFSTQDEPVSHAQVVINFLTAEGFYDPTRSTAEWDQSIVGAASGVFTLSGGSAKDGDFNPGLNTTITADSYAQFTANWRKVNIAPGVVVNVLGSRPFTMKALTFQLDGEIRANGATGGDVSSSVAYTGAYSSSPAVAGGVGGAGGGKGGGTDPNNVPLTGTAGSGIAGNDVNAILASAQAGGRGGLGGGAVSGTAYLEGGGGGGGGGRLAGTNGANASQASPASPYASWNGPGGNGGAGALGNDTLTPLVGGAGGGAGGNGGYNYPSYLWGSPGGGGGGGGGAVIIQTASNLTIGTSGAVRARGGAGGKASGYKSGWSSGPGGGGGGGSILLRSSKGFNIANPAASLDVAGGAGNTVTGTYCAPFGGNGGTGFVRLEDPNGGIGVPGGTAGTYNPVGAGVPSYVYSKFIDVGVDNPKLTNFKSTDFSINAGNDAVLIEMQAAIEDPKKFGFPKTTAIDSNENSTNLNEVSAWLPIRLIDNTPGGTAFNVPANTNHLIDAIFPIDTATAGKSYKFFRIRITFQLDPTQTAQSPLPFVDQLRINFDFNF